MVKVLIKNEKSRTYGITPYTPLGRSKLFAKKNIEVISEDFFVFPRKVYDIDGRITLQETTLFVNKRLCKCRACGWNEDLCIIQPLDEPPLKRPRKTEQRADEVYMRFCRTDNWQDLLHQWDRSCHYMFRGRLLENLKNYKTNKDCDNCPFKFKCYTEK